MPRHTSLQKTARVIRPACGLLFALFSFGYLYGFQADLLALWQHALAQGQTTYSPFVGALILTVLLWGLQLGVNYVVKYPIRFYALSFFPSCLLLALCSSVHFEVLDRGLTGFGPWGFVAVSMLWVAMTWVVLNFPDVNSERAALSTHLWPNLLEMMLLALFVGAAGNSHEVLHYELRMARHLHEEAPDKALQVAERAEETSRSLSVMRAYALSRQGALGERLFAYPQPFGADGLLPLPSDTLFIGNLPGRIYRSLGGRPASGLEHQTVPFLRALVRRPSANAAVGDYLLCAHLLERDLTGFSEALPRYYASADLLPTHYREALVLHCLGGSSDTLCTDSTLLARFSTFRAYLALPGSATAVDAACRKDFGATYWYYYYFPYSEK